MPVHAIDPRPRPPRPRQPHPRQPRPRRRLVLVAGLLVTAPLLVAGSAVAHGPDRTDDDPLPGHTIVAVEGDAAHGFSVFRLDGSSEHPPTLSESTAECHEDDEPTLVAVCVAEVETRFAGLDDVRLSLAWAQRHHGGSSGGSAGAGRHDLQQRPEGALRQ